VGRSRGGLTTKIHLLADALGRPLRFGLTGGQVHESRTAEMMLAGVEGDAVIADKAYDSNAIRSTVKAAGMKAVIPPNRSRKRHIRHDKELYRERNRIERCFNKLKHFRRLATRYDRRAVHFLAFLCLAGAMLWMR
jgi:transposase